jgi:hypothetical protein
MALERGDVQFVHNHTLLHDRTAFEDYPEPPRRPTSAATVARTRGCPAPPPVFAQRYGSVVAGARGGVVLTRMRA